MKPVRLAALALIALTIIGCSFSVDLGSENQPTATPPENTPSLVPSPTATPDQPEPTVPALPSPTPDQPEPTAPPVNLTLQPQRGQSRSLYMLADHGVWVIRHDTTEAVRLTSPDSIVTAFDVSPVDGRLAYATKSGKLYVILPHEDPRLLMELEGKSEIPSYISGIDWSPQGDTLAFAVDFDNQGNSIYLNYPAYPSGIWTYRITDHEAVWLRSNRYLTSNTDDVNLMHTLHRPVWSPDQLSLMLEGGYWEWTNINWLFPLQYTEDARFLNEVKTSSNGGPQGWMNAAWMPDGQSLLLSGEIYAQFSSLVLYDLMRSEPRTLIDGQSAGLYIFDAFPVPSDSYLPGETAGIQSGPNRFVFLATCMNCAAAQQPRLYVQATIDGNLQGQAVGPERLCSLKDQFGNDNSAHHVEWTPDMAGGVLICGGNEIYMVDMRQPSPTLTDLLPFLPPHPDGVPLFRWGEP